MHLTRPVRIVAVVAKFDLSDEVVRAMGAKHRYSRGVRTATCEGFKHAQQHLAQGLCVRSRLIKVTTSTSSPTDSTLRRKGFKSSTSRNMKRGRDSSTETNHNTSTPFPTRPDSGTACPDDSCQYSCVRRGSCTNTFSHSTGFRYGLP